MRPTFLIQKEKNSLLTHCNILKTEVPDGFEKQ